MRRSRGFSFLELLLAIAVLATMLPLLLQAMGESHRAIDVSQSMTRAVLLARSRLAEGASTSSLRAGVETGRHDEMRWQLEVKPYDQSHVSAMERRLTPWLLKVSVEINVRGTPRQISLETVVLTDS